MKVSQGFMYGEGWEGPLTPCCPYGSAWLPLQHPLSPQLMLPC